jgi:hypothetical protein
MENKTQYNYKSIPTVYKGIRFRSQLEARWACFFDLVKWNWEYEEENLNGWIPDFIIHGAKEDVLVEVKHFTQLQDFKDSGEIEKIITSKEKSDRREVLLLGKNIIFAPLVSEGGWYLPRLGWFLDSEENSVIFFDDTDNHYGFLDSLCSYHDRISGRAFKECHYKNSDMIREHWITAKNTVQWKR